MPVPDEVVLAEDLDEDVEEFFLEPPAEVEGGELDEELDRLALFAPAELDAVPRFTVTGFVWNERINPRPAAVPAMTNGARRGRRPPLAPEVSRRDPLEGEGFIVDPRLRHSESARGGADSSGEFARSADVDIAPRDVGDEPV